MIEDKAFYIKFLPPKHNHAGNKARDDINNICESTGFICDECLEEYPSSKIGKIKDFFSLSTVQKVCSITKKKDGVRLLQYPFYFNPLVKSALKKYIKQNKTILLIHDVDSLRAIGKDKIRAEVDLFNDASFIIVHNEKMKEKLTDLGVNVPMIELGIFDYLLDDAPRNNRMETDVAFAGNLSKSNFLNDISKVGISINLYGPGYNERMKGANVTYKGCYPPNQVPFVLEAKFGLIWDGDSLMSCNGITGEYLKYNNPHKLSLYIASGLPVIVWKKSAIADFVLYNNVGIAVDSIFEIKDMINKISSEEYAKMRGNVSIVQKRICKGEYTKTAIKKAISIIK